MGQLDTYGSGGLLQSGLLGRRVSSKNVALGLAEMTADFVNAYILGNVGTTGANLGACASFLYNLRQGVQDIRSGKFRVSVIGSSEAPITPDIIEGYRTMGALAEDDALNRLDGRGSGEPDYARACRPFAENCGFTLGRGLPVHRAVRRRIGIGLGRHGLWQCGRRIYQCRWISRNPYQVPE